MRVWSDGLLSRSGAFRSVGGHHHNQTRRGVAPCGGNTVPGQDGGEGEVGTVGDLLEEERLGAQLGERVGPRLA